MFKKLFSILTGEHPLLTASTQFTEMLQLSEGMILEASEIYWGKTQTPEDRTALYERDVQLNRLERQIRKAVVSHLSGPVTTDVPFGLLLMSLVKDIERLGDYAKNLSEVPHITGQAQTGAERNLPDDAVTRELREIASSIERLAREAPGVYADSNQERARELTVEGRSVAKRCDQLIGQIAAGNYQATTAVDLTLGTRFYKRIQGHLLNLLSSVLMPLHKLDYYDEKAELHP